MPSKIKYVVDFLSSIWLFPINCTACILASIFLINTFDFHYFREGENTDSGYKYIIVAISSDQGERKVLTTKFFIDGSPQVSKYMAVYIKSLPKFIEFLKTNNLNHSLYMSEKTNEVQNEYENGLTTNDKIWYRVIEENNKYQIIEVNYRFRGSFIFRYKVENGKITPLYVKTVNSDENTMLGVKYGFLLFTATFLSLRRAKKGMRSENA